MINTGSFNFLAGALVLSSFMGCAKQSPRASTKIDSAAALQPGLPWRIQDGRAIAFWVDPKSVTTSTLYGNDVAIDAVRSSGVLPTYPPGTKIALMTWRQREDDRWFGANIPATVRSVELVTVTSGPANAPHYLYQLFEGNSIRETLADDSSTLHGRTAYLLSQRPAVMP